MEIWWVGLQGKMTLVMLLLVSFSSQGVPGIGYDCGSKGQSIDEYGMRWVPDFLYVETGNISQVLQNTSIRSEQMNSLRFFPDQNKACYTIPLFDIRFDDSKYLIRAGFYYGNYDGRSKPPTFDLQIDGNRWATVATSLDQPIFKEVIVMPLKVKTSICVARTREGEIPFISSIEKIELPLIMYRWMLPTHALYLEHRLNFGGNETLGLADDKYKRMWDPANPTGYTKTEANFSSLIETVDDDPSIAVVNTAIEASSPSDEINITFNFSGIQRFRYITLYFTEVKRLQPDQNRTLTVSFGDRRPYLDTVTPRYQMCDEIDGFTYLQNGSLQITISTENSPNHLPPIVNAMEIFTMVEFQLRETSAQDLEGLLAFTYRDGLRYWSGDPCLPVNSTWEWLACNEEDTPRITALYLASYGLRGTLGNFSEMDALEVIDLHNNSLKDRIPDFLGELPNLRVLNLSNNDFWGQIPESLLNKKIALDVSGNPRLEFPKKKKTRLIIGLSVGFGLLAACLVLATFLYYRSKRTRTREAEE